MTKVSNWSWSFVLKRFPARLHSSFFEGRTGSPTAPLLAFRSTRVAPGSDMGCGGSAQGARVHDLDAFADVSPSNSEVLAKPVPRLEHMRTMELRVISACNGWNWLAPCVNRPHFLLELNSHCRSQDSQSYWFTRTSLTKKNAQSCQNPRWDRPGPKPKRRRRTLFAGTAMPSPTSCKSRCHRNVGTCAVLSQADRSRDDVVSRCFKPERGI